METFLAQLYTDQNFLRFFLNSPLESFKDFELTAKEQESLLKINKEDLIIASKGFINKREKILRYKKKKQSWIKKNLKKLFKLEDI
ncbi:MAG: hypothetical protein KDK36_15830 [Leptospiraceae bacterium]|nr:hypothetical protein [Leptospiraceae bacterium]